MNILITGVSSGLGLGLAKYYLEKGHTVYGLSRRENPELSSFDNFKFLKQDISRFEELKTGLSSFLHNVNELELVILNAGIMNSVKDLTDTTLEEISEVMDVNVWANKVIIETLFAEVRQISQVVAVSSGASVSGARGWNVYSVSKAALNMVVSLYAKEYTDTHFCALAPGLVDTAMQDYIYSLTDYNKFPVIKRLQEAKGTDTMPDPVKAAVIFSEAVEKAKKYESGSFLDVRKI